MNKKEWEILADKIRKRDKNTCRKCNKKSIRFETKFGVHHIIPFRISKSNSPINLITACNRCHTQLENNYRRLGLTNFLKKYMRDNLKLYFKELESKR